MTYPRTRNGWLDDGSSISTSKQGARCPKCHSSNYRETISKEQCYSCGLICDYWGGHTNAVYDEWLAHRHVQQEQEQEARDREAQDW